MKKRVFSILLMYALLLTVIVPFRAFAESGAAKIGDITYPSLQEAIAALKNGDTLELLSDTDVGTTQLSFKASCRVVGNGYKISSSNTDYALVLENDIGDVSFENIVVEANAGGAFKARKGVNLTLKSGVTVSATGTAVLFTTASENSTMLVEDGVRITAGKEVFAIGNNLNGRKLTVNGGNFVTTGGNMINAENVEVTVNGGVFINEGPSRAVIASGTTKLIIKGGAFYNNKADSNSAVLCMTGNAEAKIYDGYFYNGGEHRALTKEDSATDGVKKELAIYGGTFVVTNTGAAVRSDDSNRPVGVYGGTFINYFREYAVAGTYKLYGGYQFIVNGLTGSVNESNVTRTESGEMLTINGLYCCIDKNVPVTAEGASVRLVEDSNGIRFESVISKEAIDYANGLKDENTEISYGTVICPSDYLEGLHGFSMNVLSSTGKTYENIVGEEGVSTDGSGNVTLRAALVNLQSENIGRNFSAVSYLSYVKDGVTVYIYSAYAEQHHSRSMSRIADEALKDVKPIKGGVYQYEFNGAYSPYTEAQRATLQGYLDAVNA